MTHGVDRSISNVPACSVLTAPAPLNRAWNSGQGAATRFDSYCFEQGSGQGAAARSKSVNAHLRVPGAAGRRRAARAGDRPRHPRRWALPVALRLPPDSVAWRCRQLRTALAPRAIQLCLPLQIRFPNSSMLVKQYSTPTRHRSNRHRSGEQSRASPPRLRVDVPRSIGPAGLRLA